MCSILDPEFMLDTKMKTGGFICLCLLAIDNLPRFFHLPYVLSVFLASQESNTCPIKSYPKSDPNAPCKNKFSMISGIGLFLGGAPRPLEYTWGALLPYPPPRPPPLTPPPRPAPPPRWIMRGSREQRPPSIFGGSGGAAHWGHIRGVHGAALPWVFLYRK